MHPSRCLNIPELRSRIFGYVQLDDDSKSLAHLARTCWSFSDPALDILWRSQPNLWQLIHVMPSDLWVVTTENAFPEDEVDEDDDFAVFFQVINFVRELRATDWERFDYYGRKIQALEYPNDDVSSDINEDTVTVHEDILAALSSYRPVLNPLPNLKKLTLNLNLPHIPKCIPFIQCFLGPSITRIVIIMDQSDTMYPLYSMMSRLCPNIQTIRIHESSKMSDYSLDIFQLVSTSQHLVDVQFGRWIVPTPDVILHMGRLSSLRSWTEFLLPVGDDDLLRFTTNDGQFSNLRVFGCYSYFWGNASKVMDSMKCPFESLSLQLLLYSELPPTEFISSILRNHALPLSLTRFQLLSGDHRIPPGHAVDVYQSFEPLFTLRALQSLDIQLSPHHALGDSWLAAASRSWPLLQKLLIRTTVTRNATMTLGGLVPLVQGCPHLESLGLSALCHPFDLQVHPGICNRNIETISFYLSPILHPVGVFRCLVSLFPMLETVNLIGCSGSSRDWTKFKNLLSDSLKG